MIKITVWKKYNPKTDTYEHNHTELCWVNRDKPLPKKPEFKLQKTWKNYKWEKTFAYLKNNKVTFNNGEIHE